MANESVGVSEAHGKKKGERKATVLVIAHEGDEEVEFVFLRKASQNEKLPKHPHAGHMCFTGGMRKDDEHPITTGLRECYEEISWPDNYGLDLINTIPKTYTYLSNIDVYPYLALLEKKKNHEDNHPFGVWVRDKMEIHEIFVIKLSDLVHGFCYQSKINIKGRDNLYYYGPTFKISPFHHSVVPRVWGMTAGIMTFVLSVMRDEILRVHNIKTFDGI